MRSKSLYKLCLVFLLMLPFAGHTQFILNGDATLTQPECAPNTPTYELTPAVGNQFGSMWYKFLFNLNTPFDLQFQIFLGNQCYNGCSCNSNGADGIVFVFQPDSTGAGQPGGGMGYGGISPSLGIEFDTYQNSWDPAYCHVSIEKNGDVNHTDLSGNQLAGPSPLVPGNVCSVPDGNWHPARITWNPVTDSIKVFFDCVLVESYAGNIIANIFGGNPNVYWGFTAGTGGSYNLQEICVQHSYLNNLRDTALCLGASVPLVVHGGATYNWTPAAGLSCTNCDSTIATPSVTTKYFVTITDACNFKTYDSVTIAVSNMQLSHSLLSKSICGNNGADSVIATGGILPYTYTWSPSGNTTAAATGLTAGVYTITVSDKAGCTKVIQDTMPGAPPFKATTDTVKNISCFGAHNGRIALLVSGGTKAYTYNWSPVVSNNSMASGLSAGTYSITIHDSNGCAISDTITLTQPAALVMALDSAVNPSCYGTDNGRIVILTSGGTKSYTYTWSPPVSSGASAGGLSGGKYMVTVTDSNGCTTKDSATLIQPARLVPVINGKTALCYGQADTLSATGGGTYQWSSGQTSSMIIVTPAADSTYTVTVTKGACSNDTSISLTVHHIPLTTISPDSKVCEGTPASINASGACSYQWSNGATSGSIVVVPSSTTTYTLVAGCFGCDTTLNITITVIPSLLQACCDTTIVSGDTASLSGSGSVQSSYVWSPGFGLSCTNCPNPVATPSVTVTYTVISTDTSGCNRDTTITVTVNRPCNNLFVPNVFTPNNDGINDDFVVSVDTLSPTGERSSWSNFSFYSIVIFDRWGKEVYSSTDPSQPWNGRVLNTQDLVPDGVYYYVIKTTCGNANSVKKGFVEVLGEK